jgi:hypothetical protein
MTPIMLLHKKTMKLEQLFTFGYYTTLNTCYDYYPDLTITTTYVYRELINSTVPANTPITNFQNLYVGILTQTLLILTGAASIL